MIHSNKEYRLLQLRCVVASVALLCLFAACGEGPGIGSKCSTANECGSEYQCLLNICAPRCGQNADCGDGFNCDDSGLCIEVLSSVGDVCLSEWQCGVGQSCQLESSDDNNDNLLGGTCQLKGSGGNVGASCSDDDQCQTGLCSLRHCTQLCETNSQCPPGASCALIPRLLESDSANFFACLQSTGVLSMEIEMDSPSQRLHVPVPSSAQSFALVATVGDSSHLVGATRVVAPSGALLFAGSDTPDQLLANRIRYLRSTGVSTLMVPNSNVLSLETGIYQIDMEASLPPFGLGTEIPKVTVFYKLDTSRILDLHFYFLDLEDHPCNEGFGSETIDAITAANSPLFLVDYLGEIRKILADGGIQTGVVSYTDIERADLDGLAEDDLGDLLSLATNDTGIAIFFVRSLAPDGVQTRFGGTPGPPRSPGTASSGIAISADTLCYRPWESMARVTGHSLASQMGLWNNRDPLGIPDPITDTDPELDGGQDNLMFFGEFGGTNLTPGQQQVLSRYPGLR